MSGHPKRTLQAHPPRQNRESHINLGLISRGLTPQIQEPSQSQDDALDPIEESTASRDNSAQLGSFHPKEGNVNFGEQYTPVDKSASAQRGQGYSKIMHDSPWKTYEKGHELKLHQFVTVAVRKAPRRGKVAIKAFADRDANRKLDMLHKICHKRFVTLLEIFEFRKTWYAVFEHVVISLTQVVNSPAYPTERQLSAIVGQILEGLAYLASEGLQHGSLTCSNVLVKPDGEIKLADQEDCGVADRSNPCDVRAIGHITMVLMQKYAKEDGAIGIENLNRWSMDSDAVKFLSMTTSAESIEELRKHALFKHSWREEDLELLEELASVSVHRAYKYHT